MKSYSVLIYLAIRLVNNYLAYFLNFLFHVNLWIICQIVCGYTVSSLILKYFLTRIFHNKSATATHFPLAIYLLLVVQRKLYELEWHMSDWRVLLFSMLRCRISLGSYSCPSSTSMQKYVGSMLIDLKCKHPSQKTFSRKVNQIYENNIGLLCFLQQKKYLKYLFFCLNHRMSSKLYQITKVTIKTA